MYGVESSTQPVSGAIQHGLEVVSFAAHATDLIAQLVELPQVRRLP